jgi:carboxyl-terminal processing protease
VLVDGGSASASEIVAGAVQDLDRGVLIGDPTFGKGLGQSVVSFESGEALKLTTAKYYTPSGRLIQRVDYFHDDKGVITGDTDNGIAGRFATRNGRPVEGHGGIKPDIEIASPRPGPLGTELWRQGAFLDFVNYYRAKHPNLTSPKIDMQGLSDFRSWLDSTHFRYETDGMAALDTLRKLVAATGQTDSLQADFQRIAAALDTRRNQDFAREGEFIQRSLEGELAANMFGARGRIEASFDEDALVQKSLEVFANKPEYARLLAVSEGSKKE